MIVNCTTCTAKYNNETVSDCPICAYQPRRRTPNDQQVRNEVQKQFRASGHRSRE